MTTLRQLPTPAMITVLQELLERPENQAIFDAHPLLNAYRPHLETTLQALLQSRSEITSLPPQEVILRERLQLLDQRHDTINTVVYRLLGVAAQILPDPKEAAFFQELQQELYPHGLRVNSFKRSDEAAEALRLQTQIQASPDTRKALDSLELVYGPQRFHVGTLLHELFDVADQMRLALRDLAALPPASQAKSDSEARQLFGSWVSRFQDSARLLLQHDPASLSSLLAPILAKLR